jgi:hypothetical protein
MERFTFASALNFNMGYHIKLDADAHKQCTIVLPWNSENKNTKVYANVSRFPGCWCFFKSSCLRLSKIWNMLKLTFYIDDLLILTNRSFKDHLPQLEMALARLLISGMRVNVCYLQI